MAHGEHDPQSDDAQEPIWERLAGRLAAHIHGMPYWADSPTFDMQAIRARLVQLGADALYNFAGLLHDSADALEGVGDRMGGDTEAERLGSDPYDHQEVMLLLEGVDFFKGADEHPPEEPDEPATA